jgi:predicted dinucleotide-binding enzyme
MSRALTSHFVSGGNNVTVANSRGPASLGEFATATGAKAASVSDVALNNDVVVIAIPLKDVPALGSSLFSGARANVIVIDLTNYYPRQRDGRIDAIEDGTIESEWVCEQIGHPVLKAFNTIIAPHLLENGSAPGTPGRIALPVAGDDVKAKAIVMKLVDDIGFDAFDAGTIAESWRQQPGTPVYLKDYNIALTRQALKDASKERTPQWRATSKSPGTSERPA